MAIITFLSDYGVSDHYVAAVKARILGINPGLRIVDISHHIEPFNLAHASYVLKAVYQDFPEGTVHLAAVDSTGEAGVQYIAVQIKGHFFVGADNGLFSLISEEDPSMIAVLGEKERPSLGTFPARDFLAKTAAMLASGSNLNDMGTFTREYKRLIGRKFRATKKLISGNVIRVDHYGNLITNIEKEVFEILSKSRAYVVSIGREKIDRIHASYNEVENGDCFVVFNRLDLLEIGISRGNASQLLGLKYDSPVNIIFDPDE